MSSSINEVKRKIDEVRRYLESRRNKRDEQGGPLTTEGGEVIMEEVEYQAVADLKQVNISIYSSHVYIHSTICRRWGKLARETKNENLQIIVYCKVKKFGGVLNLIV